MGRTGPRPRARARSRARIAELASRISALGSDFLDNCWEYHDGRSDGRYELYKTSLAYDDAEARRARGFALDTVQIEPRAELEWATSIAIRT